MQQSRELRRSQEHLEAMRRNSASASDLAEALEEVAVAATEDGELGTAAASMEEAAGWWSDAGQTERQGRCLLLASSMQRLRGDLGAARHDLGRASAIRELPVGVRRAFDVERAEQALARGAADEAHLLLTSALEVLGTDGRCELERARLLQRRAAAAMSAHRWEDSAADLMAAQALFVALARPDEAEAAALGAAVVIANVDPSVGEQVWQATTAGPPQDGGAAAQRNICGGQIAMLRNDPQQALMRFDRAREAALDITDPLAYLTAASEAARAAEALGEDVAAYGRLASAWVTLGDLLGEDAGRQLVRPLLEQLRDRLGSQQFTVARKAYEQRPA